jgi:hypothetical protein
MVAGAVDPSLLPDGQAVAWPGWSWVAGVVASMVVVLGAAWGRPVPGVAGAAIVLGVCALDTWRAFSEGAVGTRWMALSIDVLPALAPLAFLLVLSAAAARRPVVRPALRASWTAAGAAGIVAVVVAVRENTTAGTTILVVAGLLVLVALLRAAPRPGIVSGPVGRRASPPTARLAAALLFLAAIPATTWSSTVGHPFGIPGSVEKLLLLGSWFALANVALALARSAARADPGVDPPTSDATAEGDVPSR